jgi:hypothetical protein
MLTQHLYFRVSNTGHSTIYSSAALCWALAAFQFNPIHTVGRTPWTGDQPIVRVLPIHGTTQTQNKHTQTSRPRVGFEPMIPVFERAKTVHALDSAATVISTHYSQFFKITTNKMQQKRYATKLQLKISLLTHRSYLHLLQADTCSWLIDFTYVTILTAFGGYNISSLVASKYTLCFHTK